MNIYYVTKPTYVVQADAAERVAVDLTGFEGTATEGVGGAEDAAETRTGGDEEKDTALKSRKPASRVWQFFSPRYVPQLEGPTRLYQMQAMRPGAHLFQHDQHAQPPGAQAQLGLPTGPSFGQEGNACHCVFVALYGYISLITCVLYR